MKTLVLANHQAAVGRSTVAAILVHHLARHGHRVLAIDLDYRGVLGRSLRQSGMVAPAPLAADALTGNNLPRLPFAAGRPIVLIDGARRWLGLEREVRRRNELIENFQDLLTIVWDRFDACVIDTCAQPDVCLLTALACADLVVMPTPLDEASIGTVGYLFWHSRCGIHVVQRRFNPRLRLLGLLPTLVEADTWEHERLARIVADHQELLIRVGGRKSVSRSDKPLLGALGEFAYVPHRPEIAQTLLSGQMLWEVPATAARAVWNEIRPSIEALCAHLTTKDIRS